MTDNLDASRKALYATLEKKVIEYVDLLNRIFFSDDSEIWKVFPSRVKDAIASIQLLDADEFLSVAIRRSDLVDITPEQREILLQNIQSNFVWSKPELEIPHIFINFDAFTRIPEEIPFLLEDILLQVAINATVVNYGIKLNEIQSNPKLKSLLPINISLQIDGLIASAQSEKMALNSIELRKVGFAVVLISRRYELYQILDNSMEDLRTNILRTLMEARIYGEEALEGKAATEIQTIIEGINALRKKFQTQNNQYARELLCILFLTEYLARTENARILLINSNNKGFESALEKLISNLVNMSYAEFLDNLASDPKRLKIFRKLERDFKRIIWKNEGRKDEQ